MNTPFSLAPLDELDDVELGHISEYRHFMPGGEAEALERALTDIEAEITRRGRLLFLVDADNEEAALKHQLVQEWMRRGWQVKTVRPCRNRLLRLSLVRLVAPGKSPKKSSGAPRASRP